MNPLMGLMKLAEFGMDKAGIRDSMATREKMMQQKADDKFAADTGGMQMGPAFVSEAELGTIKQDGFDKVMGLMDRMGMNDRTGARSPTEFLLEKTGVIGPRTGNPGLLGLMEILSQEGLSAPQSQAAMKILQPTPVPNLVDETIDAAERRRQAQMSMAGGMM